MVADPGRHIMQIAILGLSITSSWGNGHATTYRALVRQLAARGHEVTFLERDLPWYAANRDMPKPPGATTVIYDDVDRLISDYETVVRDADIVIVGSYVPEGIAVGEWVTDVAGGVTAFYDIDTPVTLAKLSNGGADYISRSLIERYDLYSRSPVSPRSPETASSIPSIPRVQLLARNRAPRGPRGSTIPRRWTTADRCRAARRAASRSESTRRSATLDTRQRSRAPRYRSR